MPDYRKNKKYLLCSFMVRHRLAVLLIVLVFTFLFSLGGFKIKSDVILWHLFPYDHPYFQLSARFSEVFGGGGSAAVIAVKTREGSIFNHQTLKKVKEITEEIELWNEVYRLQTNSMSSHATKAVVAGSQGSISIKPLMYPDIPKNTKEMDLLKKNIFSNPAYNGVLVSEDGTAALINTAFKENISYEKSYELLRSLATKYTDDNTSIHIVGFPMLMGWIYHHKAQMYLVFIISVLLMVGILFLVFRNFVGMIAPIGMSVICTSLGLGFVGWTGINFSPLLYVLAFLVGARMLSNAVQITHRYIQEYQSTQDNVAAANGTMQAMIMPNAAAVATDAVGFLILAVAKIVLMQHIAIMMSFWMLTITLSGILVPIICSFVPLKTKEVGIKDKSGKLARFNYHLADLSIGRGKYGVYAIVIVIIFGGGWLTSQLKVGDPTPGSPILWPDHTYNRDQKIINSIFKASSETFSLYYDGKEGSVYDPVVLNTFEKFDRHMADSLPDIYKSSMSIINMIKMFNLTYRDGDPIRYELPLKEDEFISIMGLLRSAGAQATIMRFVDKNRERAQIVLFFSDHTSDNMIRIRDAAYAFFDQNPMKIKNGEFKLAGGGIGMELALNEEMKNSHARMDILVLCAIFIMCSIAFRSSIAGVMLVVPLILSNLIAFSYMTLSNIGLSVNTLPCSAVGVGVGVDFAIYLYSRCKEEIPYHNNMKSTVLTAVQNVGPGIVFTGITLIFPILTWYFISELKFQAQMGLFLAILLLMNMIFALTLHPLILMIVKPKFLQHRSNNKS